MRTARTTSTRSPSTRAEGPVRLKLVKPCARCPIPDVDPATGVAGHAVGDVLAQYRADQRLDGALTFGMNAVDRRRHRPEPSRRPAGPGELRLRLTAPCSGFKTWQLFAGCVLIWGTTWHAITYQLSDLAPEFGVAVRYRHRRRQRRRLRALARRAAALSARRPRLAGAAGRLSLRRLLRLRLSRRALRAPRAWSRSATRPRRCSTAWARRRCSASPSAAASSSAACSGWPASPSCSGRRSRGPTGGERGTLGLVFTVASVLLSAIGSLTASRNRALGVPLLAGDGLRHALRRRGGGDRRPGPRPRLRAAHGAELVAVAGLAGARRLGAGLRLLPDAAGPARPRPGRHGRRDDAAAGARSSRCWSRASVPTC